MLGVTNKLWEKQPATFANNSIVITLIELIHVPNQQLNSI